MFTRIVVIVVTAIVSLAFVAAIHKFFGPVVHFVSLASIISGVVWWSIFANE